MQKTVLDLERLLKIPNVETESGFDLSPDGSTLAYSSNPGGIWEIFLFRLDANQPATQVTQGEGAKFAPRWAPDGSSLVYLVDLDGSENYDIYRYDLTSGKHSNLTPETPDAVQPGFCWSPDGQWIAFSSNRSGHFSTYIMPAAGGQARLVFDIPQPDWETSWSPEGKWLATTVEAQGQDYETYLVPIEGGEPRLIEAAGEPAHAREVSWSPQGQRIAFTSDLHEYSQVGIYNLSTKQVVWLPELDGNQETPAWSPDGKQIAFVIQHGATTSLGICELSTLRITKFQIEAGIHAHPKFTPDGRCLLFIFEDAAHPADVWRLNLEDGSFQQITSSWPQDLEYADFGALQEVAYPGIDGRLVPALLYKPSSGSKKPAPAVIYIHGGPNWLARAAWDPAILHMVSRGWTVLAPNYRGSTGYGRAWQLANRYDLGGGDTQDIAAGADYMVKNQLADPKRIAVTGRSYGGYLTMTSLTQFPNHWVAGSAVVPFLNWFTGHENSRKDLQHWDLENFGDPERDHDLYYQRSPFFYLDRVTVPVQFICGANDPRCPASESIQAKVALDSQGKSCELLLYPDEGHHFLKTENVIDAELRRSAFLAEALTDKTYIEEAQYEKDEDNHPGENTI